MIRTFALTLLLAAMVAPALAQEQSAGTIEVTTRLVQVDVVVQNRDGQPVKGLAAEDFILLEDGKPQKLAVFTPAVKTRAAATPPAASSEPGVVTNRPAVPDAPITILLLDLLNTSFHDRPAGMLAIRKFLENHLQPGDLVAVFVLQQNLRMLQGFSSDPTVLKAAVRSYRGNPVEPGADRSGSQMGQVALDSMPPQDRAKFQEVLEGLKAAEDRMEEQKTEDRIRASMDALRIIARAAQGYPGRKSLVWVSAGFPLLLTRGLETRSFEVQVARTMAVLTEAQIALYPADIRGLTAAAPPPIRTVADIQRYPEMLAAQSRSMHAPIDTMKTMAELTGGRAFYNRNDIERSIAAAIEDGLIYYTLAYYPENKEWDSRLRKVQVKVRTPGVRVRHREGYIAAATPGPKDDHARREFDEALTTSPLPASQLLLHARLTAPQKPGGPYTVQVFVEGSSLQFSSEGEEHVARLDFRAVAALDGKYFELGGESLQVGLKGEMYEKARTKGILHSIPVQLRQGEYRLRVGVRDNNSGKIGTADFAMKVGAPGD